MAGDPVSAGMQIAGQVIGAIGTYRQGVWQKKQDYANALAVEQAGSAQEARVRDAAREATGNQIAGQFANGMQGGTGSAIDAVNQSLVNGALDALTIRQGAAAKADTLRTEGNVAKTTSVFNTMTALLGAGSSAVKMNSDWAAASRGTISSGGRSGNGSGGGYNSGIGGNTSGYEIVN